MVNHGIDTDARASRVYALDNVALDLPLAGVGSRILAAALDYLLVGATVVVWVLLAIFVGGAVGIASGTAGVVVVAVAILGIFLIEYGYFAGFEIALGGETPGKRVMGLVVVTREGGRPAPVSLLTRNLVRTIDIFLGVPLMAVDDRCRRLGDRLAGTLVTYSTRLDTRSAAAALRRVPRGWGGREVALLESFLQRRDELDAETSRRVAAQLVAAIRRDDPGFLDGLAEDEDPRRLLELALEVRAQ